MIYCIYMDGSYGLKVQLIPATKQSSCTTGNEILETTGMNLTAFAATETAEASENSAAADAAAQVTTAAFFGEIKYAAAE